MLAHGFVHVASMPGPPDGEVNGGHVHMTEPLLLSHVAAGSVHASAGSVQGSTQVPLWQTFPNVGQSLSIAQPQAVEHTPVVHWSTPVHAAPYPPWAVHTELLLQ